MSTNYYWLEKEDWVRTFKETFTNPMGDSVTKEAEIDLREHPLAHIGLMYGGNRHCFDCHEPMLRRAPEIDEYGYADPVFHDKCSKCGGKGRVALAFQWASSPERVKEFLKLNLDNKCIKNENGIILSGKEFLELLSKEGVVEFRVYIGDHFG